MRSLVSCFQAKPQRGLATCVALGCRYVDYFSLLVFIDHVGNTAVVRLRASWPGPESGDLSRPSQGRAGGWEGLSGHQKDPFKDAARYTGKMLVLGYPGPVLE